MGFPSVGSPDGLYRFAAERFQSTLWSGHGRLWTVWADETWLRPLCAEGLWSLCAEGLWSLCAERLWSLCAERLWSLCPTRLRAGLSQRAG